MTTALVAAPAVGGNLAAYQESYFGHLPHSEVFARRYYGRNLDLVQIENAIRNAELGIMAPLADLSREALRNDPAMSGMVQKRFGSLASSDWDLTPAQGVDDVKAKQLASVVRRALVRIEGFRQALYDLSWAEWDGRGALEAEWAVVAPREAQELIPKPKTKEPPFFALPHIVPRKLGWIHPGRLSFGPQRELRVVERHRQTNFYYAVGEALQNYPRGKFIWWLPRIFNDYPEREGLAPRSVYWAFFKRFSWRHRMVLTELFGLPWRIVERDKDVTVTDQPEGLDQDRDAAEALGSTTVAVMRPGSKLRVEWPNPDSVEFFSKTSAEVNEELGKLINGQHVTMQGDANRASAVVAKSDEDMIRAMGGRGLEERVQTQLIDVIVELNWGPEALAYAPKFTIRTDPPRDRKAELERVEKVLSFGAPVAENEVYEIGGLRKPLDGEPKLQILPTVEPIGQPVGKPGEGTDGPDDATANDPESVVQRVLDGMEGEDGEGAGDALDTAQKDAENVTKASAARATASEAAAPASPPVVTLPFAGYDDFDACVVDQKRAGHSDDSAHNICGALQEKVEGQRRRFRATLTAGMRALARQPTTLHGSPEQLIDRGVKKGQGYTAGWAARLADAATGASELEIFRRLAGVARGLDLERMARELERRIVHGLMLGALDSDWEGRADATVAPVAFSSRVVRLEGEADDDGGDSGPTDTGGEVPAPPESGEIRDFATKPFAEAIRDFLSRGIITRREFDRLSAAAKRRAFTVAGLARDEMLQVAKDELTRAITDGDDLHAFQKRLSQRFDDAGWTKLNSTHVETVFRNAVMGSYASGRRAQMTQPAVLSARPYWQILGVNDSRTRSSHRAQHGKVLPASDSFWAGGFPPWGHNCRCRIISRSAADLQRLGLSVTGGAGVVGVPDDGWNDDSLLE